MKGISLGSTLFAETKRSSEKQHVIHFFLGIITCDPSIYTLDCSAFTVSTLCEIPLKQKGLNSQTSLII